MGDDSYENHKLIIFHNSCNGINSGSIVLAVFKAKERIFNSKNLMALQINRHATFVGAIDLQ